MVSVEIGQRKGYVGKWVTRHGRTPWIAREENDRWVSEFHFAVAAPAVCSSRARCCPTSGGGGNPLPGGEVKMTALRRYLAALRMAVATFWHFSRPPLRELEIVEEIPAGASPQAIPGDDALAEQPPPIDGDTINRQAVERTRFYFQCYVEDQAGDLAPSMYLELNAADIVRMMGLDVDEFLARPLAVQNTFCDNMGAGLLPAEALFAAQASPTDIH